MSPNIFRNDIDDAVKITLGPTGKNGIVTVFDTTKKFDLKVITSGSALIKALSFDSASANVILELVRQAAVKTFTISGDGSTTTILFSCQLLKTSLRFSPCPGLPLGMGLGVFNLTFLPLYSAM